MAGEQPFGCSLTGDRRRFQVLECLGVAGQLYSPILIAELSESTKVAVEANRVVLLAPTMNVGELDMIGCAREDLLKPVQHGRRIRPSSSPQCSALDESSAATVSSPLSAGARPGAL